MSTTFNTRGDIILALVSEFDENPNSFSYNKTAMKFWTFNRLLKYYWDIKMGRKRRYATKKNKKTGYYELVR
jgi:hypothetical protein